MTKERPEEVWRARAEKAEKALQHMLDVGRQEYAEAYAAPIRKALDEERRQRIHEAELAREAIAHVRRLLATLDEETWERAHAEACAWLYERVKV